MPKQFVADVYFSGKVYGDFTTDNTLTEALFLDGTEVKKRVLGSMAFEDAGDYLSSIGVTIPTIFTPSTDTIDTADPNLSFSLVSQTANTVFAGPTTGSAGTPTFRSLVSADIPDLSASYIKNQSASAQSGAKFWIGSFGISDDYLHAKTILAGGSAAGTGTNPTNLIGAGVTIGTTTTYNYVQAWNSKDLYINPMGNNVVVSTNLTVGGTGTFSGLISGGTHVAVGASANAFSYVNFKANGNTGGYLEYIGTGFHLAINSTNHYRFYQGRLAIGMTDDGLRTLQVQSQGTAQAAHFYANNTVATLISTSSNAYKLVFNDVNNSTSRGYLGATATYGFMAGDSAGTDILTVAQTTGDLNALGYVRAGTRGFGLLTGGGHFHRDPTYGVSMYAGPGSSYDFVIWATDGNGFVLCDGTGTSRLVNLAHNVSIANNLTVAGTISVAHGASSQRFGLSASASGAESVAVGTEATSVGTGSTTLGYRAATTVGGGTAIGQEAKTMGSAAALGVSAHARTESVALGYTAQAGGTVTGGSGVGDIAIGYSALVSSSYGIALGYDSTVAHNYSVALGYLASTTDINQLMLGTAAQPLNISSFGSASFGSSVHATSFYTNQTYPAVGGFYSRDGNGYEAIFRSAGSWAYISSGVTGSATLAAKFSSSQGNEIYGTLSVTDSSAFAGDMVITKTSGAGLIRNLLTLHNPNTNWEAESLIRTFTDTDGATNPTAAFGFTRGTSLGGNDSSGFIVKTGQRDSLTRRLLIDYTGKVTVADLAGTGTRMAVVNADGTFSTQAIPTGTSYTFTNGLTETSGTVKLGNTSGTPLTADTDIFTGANYLYITDATYDNYIGIDPASGFAGILTTDSGTGAYSWFESGATYFAMGANGATASNYSRAEFQSTQALFEVRTSANLGFRIIADGTVLALKRRTGTSTFVGGLEIDTSGNVTIGDTTGNLITTMGKRIHKTSNEAKSYYVDFIRVTTNTASSTELTTDGSAPSGTTNRFVIEDDRTYLCEYEVVARATDDSWKVWTYRFVIDKVTGSNATISSVDTIGTSFSGGSTTGWAITMAINTANSTFDPQVTGTGTQTIRWHSRLKIIDVQQG